MYDIFFLVSSSVCRPLFDPDRKYFKRTILNIDLFFFYSRLEERKTNPPSLLSQDFN